MIYVFCPDENGAIGGIKVLYRHVDVLNQLGYSATIVHESEGFRCSWFDNETPVTSRASFDPRLDSLVVLPEICGPDAALMAPGTKKIIFNQSGSLTFRDYPIDGTGTCTPYLNSEVVATLAISEHVQRYMNHAFPSMPVMRVRWSIDSSVFRQTASKKRQVCFMPRKNCEEARQVFNILRYRGVLEEFAVVPIDNLSESEVARVMDESMFFFSFGYPEGLPLPPAEAMMSGCIVVGYDGFGGAEYFKGDVCYPVSVGDVLEFAYTSERVLKLALAAPEAICAMGERASALIAREYSTTREVDDIREAWERISSL